MNDPKLIEACELAAAGIEESLEFIRVTNPSLLLHREISDLIMIVHSLKILMNNSISPLTTTPEFDRPDWLRCDKCLAWVGETCEHWLDGKRGADGLCMFWRCKRCHRRLGPAMQILDETDNCIVTHYADHLACGPAR